MTSRHRVRRNHGARILESEIDGMALVVLENDLLRVAVLAGKGADVLELLYKPTDLDFCWAREQPLANPARRPPSAHDDAATYLDWYPGGWQEVLPSGGAPSEHGGARHGQHGEVHLAPWDHEVVTDTATEATVRFRVRLRRLPLLLERTMSLRAGEPVLRINERLVNESDVEQSVMWGQHVVFGEPFLEPGMRIRVPDGARVLPHPGDFGPGGRRVAIDHSATFPWPHAPAAGGGRCDLSLVPARGEPGEMLYLPDLPAGWYELGRPGKPAFRLEWDESVLPHLWLWQELGTTSGYPWHGGAYVLGLEPFSSHPTTGIADAIANGTALRLAPRSERTLRWSAHVLPDGLGAGS